MLQTFAASHPLATEALKQRRSTVVFDTTLFQIYKCINTELTFSKTELGCCCFDALRPSKFGDGQLKEPHYSWAGLDLLCSYI